MDHKPNTPLLEGISQYRVDFVIPRLGIDLPLGIDPFLLYKSRDQELAALHSTILKAFNYGIELVRNNHIAEARRLFDFPEVAEIGLGYTKKSKHGAGVGRFLSELIIETLRDSPLLLQRGVRHIEEMQLLSVGIGPDRVSDIAANLLKGYLIDYTQRQCQLWDVPINSGVPITHIFDPEDFSWHDGYFDLPVSPVDNLPFLFVPRRIVRTLPWINYDDFFRMEFTTYLRSKRVREHLKSSFNPSKSVQTEKANIVSIVRQEIERVDRYVDAKERMANQARPSLNYVDQSEICPESALLRERLTKIQAGTAQASTFQHLVLEILNFLFNPELFDGELEVKTVDGTERRDIIFTNDSDQSFWEYLRVEHSSFLLMFEAKNTSSLEMGHINQTAAYLGDRLGRVGFIVTRKPIAEAQERKLFSIYNDSSPRKIILVLSDDDLEKMIDMRCKGEEPMRHVQKLYRSFRTKVQ